MKLSGTVRPSLHDFTRKTTDAGKDGTKMFTNMANLELTRRKRATITLHEGHDISLCRQSTIRPNWLLCDIQPYCRRSKHETCFGVKSVSERAGHRLRVKSL